MNPKPVITRHASDSQNTLDKENAMRPMPKMAGDREMTRLKPSTDLRAASHSAPSNAPQPDAVIRKPSVCGPPPRIGPAKIGSSTE